MKLEVDDDRGTSSSFSGGCVNKESGLFIRTWHMHDHCGWFVLQSHDGHRLQDAVTVKRSFFTGRTERKHQTHRLTGMFIRFSCITVGHVNKSTNKQTNQPAEQAAWCHAEPAQAERISVPVAEGVTVVQVQLTISNTLHRNHNSRRESKFKQPNVYTSPRPWGSVKVKTWSVSSFPQPRTWESNATAMARGSRRSSAVQDPLPVDLQTTVPPRWNTGTCTQEAMSLCCRLNDTWQIHVKEHHFTSEVTAWRHADAKMLHIYRV